MKTLWDNGMGKRVTALCIGGLLVFSLAGCNRYVAGAAGADRNPETAVLQEQQVSVPASTEDALAKDEATANSIRKEETVYVLAGADGSANRVIVSDWLDGSAGCGAITDESTLTEITVVKGDSTMSGDGATKTWNVAGGDVYYRGNASAELPVAVRVAYFLDGKEMTPQEIAGKSGRVTIRFTYENRKKETVMLDGKETAMYVPFVMITGVLLSGDVFSDVTVTNGRLVNDGSRMVVVGAAFPGLAEDLGIDGEKIGIPDYVEISADAKDFALGMTVTVATNEVFRELHVDKLSSLGDFKETVSRVTDAMSRLTDGSGALYDGLCQLLEGTGALANGIGALADGSAKLADGAKNASDGASKLADGADSLASGLSTLDSNSAALLGGAKQVFETLLAEAQKQLVSAGLSIPALTVDNYEKVLDGVIASLDRDSVYAQAEKTVKVMVEQNRGEIGKQVTAAVRNQVEKAVTEGVRREVETKVAASTEETVREKVTEGVRAQVFEKVLASVNLTPESYEAGVAAGQIDAAMQQKLSAATDAGMESDEVKTLLENTVTSRMSSSEVTEAMNAAVKQQMESDTVKALIEKLTEEKMNSDEIRTTISEKTEEQIAEITADAMQSDEVKAKLKTAADGVAKIAELKASLNEYRRFYEGLRAYTAGVSQANGGAKSLADGAKALRNGNAAVASGAADLNSGIRKLHDSIPALTEGIRQLCEGADALSKGIGEFDKQVVEKIAGGLDGTLSSFTERVKAAVGLASGYNNYSGIAYGMDGTVKFIIRTEEIGE